MKKIDINNEKQILKECDFDYFSHSKCSRELCEFSHYIEHLFEYYLGEEFWVRHALVDLGRIAITLNEQDEKIKELEEKLKQSQNSKAIEELRQLDKYIRKYVCSITTERDHSLQGYIQSRVKELKGE